MTICNPLPPTNSPTNKPSDRPTDKPTSDPSSIPSSTPRSTPSTQPTKQPSQQPSKTPSGMPTDPTLNPSSIPTSIPSILPTTIPTQSPSSNPTQPTTFPSINPTGSTSLPTVIPSTVPSKLPSTLPSTAPSSIRITATTDVIVSGGTSEEDLEGSGVTMYTQIEMALGIGGITCGALIVIVIVCSLYKLSSKHEQNRHELKMKHKEVQMAKIINDHHHVKSMSPAKSKPAPIASILVTNGYSKNIELNQIASNKNDNINDDNNGDNSGAANGYNHDDNWHIQTHQSGENEDTFSVEDEHDVTEGINTLNHDV